jgi:hypothetical protein
MLLAALVATTLIQIAAPITQRAYPKIPTIPPFSLAPLKATNIHTYHQLSVGSDDFIFCAVWHHSVAMPPTKRFA